MRVGSVVEWGALLAVSLQSIWGPRAQKEFRDQSLCRAICGFVADRGHVTCICVVYLVANKIKYEVHYKIWFSKKEKCQTYSLQNRSAAGGFNQFPSEVSWSNWTIWYFSDGLVQPPTRYSLQALPVLESSFKPCRLPWRKRVSWAEAERRCFFVSVWMVKFETSRNVVKLWVDPSGLVVDMKFQRLGKVQLKVLVLMVQKFG